MSPADLKVNRRASSLQQAKKEVSEASKWARQQGLANVAPRLEWAARLIQEEINMREKHDA